MTNTKTFTRGRLRVVLDRRERGDEGTPAMVYCDREDASSTLNCALCEGTVDGIRLSRGELDWLETVEDESMVFLWGEEGEA